MSVKGLTGDVIEHRENPPIVLRTNASTKRKVPPITKVVTDDRRKLKSTHWYETATLDY